MAAFEDALHRVGIDAPLFVSQNDGTVMSSKFAAQYPVRTLSSGPTNSMRGAAFLSGLQDALVLDIGGTTSDAGALVKGFPREAPNEFEIEGVRTNFRMPDVMSIGVGGGTIVKDHDHGVEVGPQSVGHLITERALLFGGEVTTVSDVAVAAGMADFGDPTRLKGMPAHLIDDALADWHDQLDALLATARGSAEPVPLVLVGGGAFIVDSSRLTGITSVVVPDFADVANAVGAAIPQASGEIDRVVSAEVSRGEAVAAIRAEAIELAIRAGADPSAVEINDEDITQLTQLDGTSLRIRVRAVGEISMDNFALVPSAATNVELRGV
jgi:N-methylhydantoinase A/oxoprolinase/acetone carboxylase beta subunit